MNNEMPPSGSPSPELPPGTLVIDREASDTDLALVLDHPDDRCDAYLVEGTDQTVADYNPKYPADAPVTTVVFVPALEDHLSNWRRQPLDTLRDRVAEVSIQTYSYPEPRLEATGELLDDPIQMWFDGACEPVNPGGHATYGVVVKDGAEIAHEEAAYIGHGDRMTNNVAEYRALIATLEYARDEYPGRPVDVHGDSQLAIRQMTGEYVVRRDTIRPLWREAKSLARQLDVSFQWVPREENERADVLSKQAYENHALEDALEERRQRAREEDMDIEPLNDETYRIKGEYRVDLASRTCTCPDYENRGHACKHIFAVEQYVEAS